MSATRGGADDADLVMLDAVSFMFESGGTAAAPVASNVKSESVASLRRTIVKTEATQAGIVAQTRTSSQALDDQMFGEVFPADPEPSTDPIDCIGTSATASSSGVIRCSVCGSASSDSDLGDPSSSRTTPFSRTRSVSGHMVTCDHCQMVLRCPFDALWAGGLVRH